ncbi:hypothetical protein HDU98_008961, partial [Podochytrium sp. JEL0797]
MHHQTTTTTTSTDKTLLALIEQERAKFLHLDQTHTTLLANLSHLQQAHKADMARLHAKHSHEIATRVQEQRDTRDIVSRCARSLAALLNRNNNAASHRDLILPGDVWNFDQNDPESSRDLHASAFIDLLVSRVESLLQSHQDRLQAVEDSAAETRAAKKLVSDKLATREHEMKKLAVFAKDRDDAVAAERDAKLKLEVRVLQLERGLSQRQGELVKLNEMYQHKVEEAMELVKLRDRFENTCRTLDELVKREKMYLEEIEVLSTHERKLVSDLESVTKKHARATKDLETLQTTSASDLQTAKQTEQSLRKDLIDAKTHVANLDAENTQLEQIIQGGQKENNRLAEKIIHLDAVHLELQQTLKQNNTQIQQFKQNESNLQSELHSLLAKIDLASTELETLERQLSDTRVLLEQETAAKIQIQQHNASRLELVAAKLTQLQQSLSDTQSQLTDLQTRETGLRDTVREREETISVQQQRILEMEQRVVELQRALEEEGSVVEGVKTRKKEELLAVQEKFMLAKQAMDAEVANLRNQLGVKTSQG